MLLYTLKLNERLGRVNQAQITPSVEEKNAGRLSGSSQSVCEAMMSQTVVVVEFAKASHLCAVSSGKVHFCAVSSELTSSTSSVPIIAH